MAKQRKMRWSDRELALIKATFAEQDEALVLIRKFLLQGDMTADEMKYLKTFTDSPEILGILKKAINPKLDKQAAPFQSVDLFSSMDFNPTPADHAYLIICARTKACQYLTERFDALEGKETEGINFDELVKPLEIEISEGDVSFSKERTYINMIARNFLLSHIDSQLFNSLGVIAGTKDESPEQQKKRLSQDSSK